MHWNPQLTRMACALCLLAQTARADEPAPRLWQESFRKVQPLEYAATVALGVSTLAVSLWVDPRDHGARTGVLFDKPVRDALRLHTRAGRDAARLVGDLGYRSLLFIRCSTPW